MTSAKLEEHIINFDSPESWSHLVRGDVAFSALGTTIKQAGSKSAQYKVDYTYQYQFAKAAAENGIGTYVLVSSFGASADSKIFYSRMKGELDRDVQRLAFSSIYLIQPGMLAGEREKERIGEKVGFVLLNSFNSVGLFKKYKPIQGKTVATAMVNAGIAANKGIHIVSLQNVFLLAGSTT